MDKFHFCQDENTKGALPAAGLRWHKTQARERITECLLFVATFQIKSVLKLLYQWRWHHVNNPTIQRSSWYCAALYWKNQFFMTKFSFNHVEGKGSENVCCNISNQVCFEKSLSMTPRQQTCVEKNQFLWRRSVLNHVECLHKSF